MVLPKLLGRIALCFALAFGLYTKVYGERTGHRTVDVVLSSILVHMAYLCALLAQGLPNERIMIVNYGSIKPINPHARPPQNMVART